MSDEIKWEEITLRVRKDPDVTVPAGAIQFMGEMYYLDTTATGRKAKALEILLVAVKSAVGQFKIYAENHRMKKPPDHEKAAVNDYCAARLNEALEEYERSA